MRNAPSPSSEAARGRAWHSTHSWRVTPLKEHRLVRPQHQVPVDDDAHRQTRPFGQRGGTSIDPPILNRHYQVSTESGAYQSVKPAAVHRLVIDTPSPFLVRCLIGGREPKRSRQVADGPTWGGEYIFTSHAASGEGTPREEVPKAALAISPLPPTPASAPRC